MLLKLDQANIPMKRVYLLSEELKVFPEQIALAQALTLNTSKPHIGLKGTHGLFGSQTWWESIEQKKMPLLFLSGIIKDAYVAGQDPSSINNTIDLILDNGSVQAVGIYVNNEQDVKLFRMGHKAEIVYVLDELKRQPAMDGGVNYSEIALEMAVSLQPVE